MEFILTIWVYYYGRTVECKAVSFQTDAACLEESRRLSDEWQKRLNNGAIIMAQCEPAEHRFFRCEGITGKQ